MTRNRSAYPLIEGVKTGLWAGVLVLFLFVLSSVRMTAAPAPGEAGDSREKSVAGGGPHGDSGGGEAKKEAKKKATPAVEDLGGGRFRVGKVRFDAKKRLITIPAAVHMREGPVEYVLVTKQGKVHETVFVTSIDPHHLHVAVLLLGMKPRANLGPEKGAAKLGQDGVIKAWVEWDRNGPPAKLPLNEAVALLSPETKIRKGTLPAGPWLYNGSSVAPDGTFLASKTGSIISIIRDPEALINNPGGSRDNDEIHTPHAKPLPKLGHPVRIVLKIP